MWLLDFHPLVEADLAEAIAWYEQRTPGCGGRLLDEAMGRFRQLPTEALLYSIRFADIRRVNLPGFPNGVFYLVARDAVVVLAVMHGARDSRLELESRRRTVP
jgi:hypothetical protein